MFTRTLKKSNTSILLLGPRGTGKSTWIKHIFPQVIRYDLLNNTEALRLGKEPSLLYNELATMKPRSWVIIDEVQKVPALLDEVHRLIEDHDLRFILSGSSARKLKKGGANLLAGRAHTTFFFPLTSLEIDFNLRFPQCLATGLLPMAYTSKDPLNYLRTYAETYLQEEIKGEALTRSLGSFARFLEVASRQNGQITNVSNISRDALVPRQTVQGYFDILVDTLLGFWLPAWKLKRSTKQVAHSKFYFFDTGVARALSGRLAYPPTEEEYGSLLETFILNEIRAYLSYSNLHYPLYFWSSHDGVEVDVFCETRKKFLALEIKAAKRWDRSFNKGLKRIKSEIGSKKVKCVGVYLGEREALFDEVQVLPVKNFLKALWQGDLID